MYNHNTSLASCFPWRCHMVLHVLRLPESGFQPSQPFLYFGNNHVHCFSWPFWNFLMINGMFKRTWWNISLFIRSFMFLTFINFHFFRLPISHIITKDHISAHFNLVFSLECIFYMPLTIQYNHKIFPSFLKALIFFSYI